MSKEKIPEASQGKKRSQANDHEPGWDLTFNSNAKLGKQWSKAMKFQ